MHETADDTSQGVGSNDEGGKSEETRVQDTS